MKAVRLLARQSLSGVTAIRLAWILLILTSSLSHAQQPGLHPEFEVASIKPNKTNERMYYGLRGASLTVRNMTVKGLIQVAWGKRDFEISGGPGWTTSECFDIDAKAERPARATPDMLKSLLMGRFNLAVHSETKEAAVYSLVVARGGLRMKLSADQADPEKGGTKQLAPGRMVGDGIPMYIIVNLLSNALGRSVVNNTGLTGKYDLDLRYVPDSVPSSDAGDAFPQADALDIAIVTAVEKQLGLKLISIRAPQQVLVIDHVDRLSAN